MCVPRTLERRRDVMHRESRVGKHRRLLRCFSSNAFSLSDSYGDAKKSIAGRDRESGMNDGTGIRLEDRPSRTPSRRESEGGGAKHKRPGPGIDQRLGEALIRATATRRSQSAPKRMQASLRETFPPRARQKGGGGRHEGEGEEPQARYKGADHRCRGRSRL